MKLWHGILLGVGLLMVIGGLLTVVFPIDNPKYAPGEACAMVERVYHVACSDEEYLGQGIWEVKSPAIYKVYPIREPSGGPPKKRLTYEDPPERGQAAIFQAAIFRVYETTNTVQPYNNVARIVINY